MTQKTYVHAIPPLPASWPSDKRCRISLVSGAIIATHPERPPVQLQDGKWQEVKKVA